MYRLYRWILVMIAVGLSTVLVPSALFGQPVITQIPQPSLVNVEVAFTEVVTGTGFVSGSVVLINNTAEPTTYDSANSRLIAQVLPTLLTAVGNATVTVMNPDGSLSNSFTIQVVQGPVITLIPQPSLVTVGAAFTEVVTGTGFVSGSVVLINNTAEPTTYDSANSRLIAQVPATLLTAAGNATVTVRNPDGSLSNSFTIQVVQGPVITLIPQPSLA